MEPALMDARNPPLDFIRDLARDRQPPGHKPRVVSDSAITLGQSHAGSGNPPRYQRFLSVGSQPIFGTRDPETSLGNSTQADGTGTPIEGNETFEDYFGNLQGASGTASGLGYDGTQPIAYIQVNDPRRYSLRTPALHNGTAPTRNKAHCELNSVHPEHDQVPLDDRVIYNQPPIGNQAVSYESTQGLYPQYEAPMISPSNWNSDPIQYSTKPEITPEIMAVDHRSNNYPPSTAHCDTSTWAIPETRYSDAYTSDREQAGIRAFATKPQPSTSSAPIPSIMEPQAVNKGLNSVGPEYAPETPHGGSQSQVTVENSVIGNVLTPRFESLHIEGDLASRPIRHSTRSSSNQPPPNGPQPPYHPPHQDVHTWSHNLPTPVADNAFRSTPTVAVPAPRPYLNFGAFLTPDPPCQISNIDLAPRPGTSPPESVPNERLRLPPNVGRRRSEQTWRSCGYQIDRARIPSQTNQLPENHSYPSPSLTVQRQVRAQGRVRREVNGAMGTCEPIPSQTPDCRPLTNNNSQPPIQHSIYIQGGLDIRKPSQPPESTLRRKQRGQQYHVVQQNQPNPEQMRQHVSPQIQSTVTVYSSDKTSQALSSAPCTQPVSMTTGQPSSERETVTKKRYSNGNCEDASVTKKRKVVGKDPEMIGTNPDAGSTLPPSQCSQQNLLTAEHDCVYFDVNSWRGDDIANSGARQSSSAGTNAQTQVQASDDDRLVEPLLGVPTGDSSEKLSEHVSPPEPSQASYYDDGMAPPAGWLPVSQDDGTSGIEYMDWGPSVDMLLDQTAAFNIEVVGSRAPSMKQYITALNPLERPAPEAFFPLAPSNFEIDQLLADCYSLGA
ncbi:unnamed protein product [Rhizoctonia solani]|uniref:Uncharacterized protein n=1 Tax=Rhizoctonia solani TaxID=456999 RepID=A0A8H3DVE3_9AGAM|nr:unnamed protein product [Rhizoctonia solani]